MKWRNSCLFFLALSTLVVAQNAENLDRAYEQALDYLKAGDYQPAETAFQEILDTDQSYTPAQIGLGRVYDAQDPGSMKAQRALAKAVSQQRRNGEAYYYLGRMYTNRPHSHMEAIEQLKLAVHFSPQLIEAWKLLADLHEQNANEKPATLAFAHALLENPDYEPFYQNLLRTAFAYQYEKIAIKTLNSFIKKDKRPGRATVDLADAHRRRGHVDKAAEILQELFASDMDWPTCKGHLVMAKTYFDQNKNELGCEAYWRAVEAIRDSADGRLFTNDLCYIMKDDEHERVVTLPPDSLLEYYTRFWRSRDPNLITQLNERIPEHYRRLSYAEMHQRRSYIGYQHSILLHERDGAFKNVNIVGDEFINKAHFPRALPRDRTINDMGVIYIRHGDPDQDIKPNNARANEYRTWIYYETAERPEMVFHFKRLGEHIGWLLEAIPSVVDNLEALHGRYMELQNRLDAEWGFSPATRGVASTLIDASTQLLEVGMTTETSSYEFEEDPLNLPYQVLTFKGEERTELELHYLIHGSTVQLDAESMLNLNKFIAIHDAEWRELERHFQQFRQQVNTTPDQWANSGFVIHETYDAPPGEMLHLEFQVTDNIGDRRAVYKDDFVTPDYFKDRLMLSDVVIAQEINPGGSATHERQGIPLEPHMFYSFPRDAFVGIYFEIYNLQPEAGGKTQYDVSFTLQRADMQEPEDRKSVVGFVKNLFMDTRKVTTQFENEGRTPDDVLYMNLQFEDRDKGEYVLTIDVRDKVSGETSQKRAKLTLF